MASAPERWHLRHDGAEHAVEITDKGMNRTATWRLDGDEVATKSTTEKRLVLDGGDRGAVGLRLPEFVGPARRVTFYEPGASGLGGAKSAAYAGRGGIDFEPEPGTAAARREEWIRAHPNLHLLRRTAAAAAGIAIPLLVAWLISKIALPAIPWPDWNIPSIRWPDLGLPSIPWPDIDLPDLPPAPPWVGTVLDAMKFIGPVVIAFVLARMELRRRRAQDDVRRRAVEPARATGPSRETEPAPEAGRAGPTERSTRPGDA